MIKMQFRRMVLGLYVLVGLGWQPLLAHDSFPERSLTLVVPYGAGSAIDGVARALALGAQKHLGQTVLVDNRSGAGGALGAAYAARRPADGYTLALVSINPFVLSYFSKALPLHPVDDFTHVISTTGYLMAVAVRSDSKIKDMPDLVEAIRKSPGKLTYSTSGIASTGYLNMEEFSSLANIKAVHVPYKSGAEAMTALLAGQVDFFADATWAPFAKDGRVRPLMIFANERLSNYPQVPVPTDIVKARVQQGYLMVVGPKGIPTTVLQRLHDAFKAALNEPDYKSVVEKFNLEAMYMGSDASRKATAASIPPLEKMYFTLGLDKQ